MNHSPNLPLKDRAIDDQLFIKDRAISSSIQGIGIGDLEGRIVYINDAALRMWGAASASEVIGRSSLEFAKSQEQAIRVMLHVLKNGSWEGEIEGKRKDGSPIFVHLSANIVYNDKGEPVCTMDSFIDITDRKKMEEELRIKDLAIASAIDAIVIADLLGNITYVNQAFLDMWGDNDASAVLGRSAISFAKDQKHAEIIFEKILDQGSWSGEIDGVKKNGDVITVLFAGSVVMDANNHPICMMGSFSDITYRKQAEEKLAAVNEELEARVAARTRELIAANQKLQIEIEERKLIENSLRQKEQELSCKR